MLATTKKVMIWLCMYPVDETTGLRFKVAHVAYSYVNFVVIAISAVSQMTYMYKFMRIDFERALFAFMCAFGTAIVAYFSFVTHVNQHKVRNIFNKLLAIRNDSKYENEEKCYVGFSKDRIKFLRIIF